MNISPASAALSVVSVANHRLVQKRPLAFTLTELVVVIAIIVILASLIMPVMSRMGEGARVTKCIHNLRQIAAAITAFGADHNGRLPANPSGGGKTSIDGETMPAWLDGSQPLGSKALESIKNGGLWPYTKNERLYICPSLPYNDNEPEKRYYHSYAMPQYLSGQDNAPGQEAINTGNFDPAIIPEDLLDPPPPVATTFSMIARPALTVLLAEENPLNYPPLDHSAFINDGYYRRAAGNDRAATFHYDNPPGTGTGKSNVLFADGHVETLSRLDADRAFLNFYRR